MRKKRWGMRTPRQNFIEAEYKQTIHSLVEAALNSLLFLIPAYRTKLKDLGCISIKRHLVVRRRT